MKLINNNFQNFLIRFDSSQYSIKSLKNIKIEGYWDRVNYIGMVSNKTNLPEGFGRAISKG